MFTIITVKKKIGAAVFCLITKMLFAALSALLFFSLTEQAVLWGLDLTVQTTLVQDNRKKKGKSSFFSFFLPICIPE